MTPKKRILILGGSLLQIPAIKAAKQRNYEVGVVDFNPNAPGASIADYFFEVSTIDEAGVLKVARKFLPDGIVTIATDMPMRALAFACKELGLPAPSIESVLKTTDKTAMAEALSQSNVPIPNTLKFSPSDQEIEEIDPENLIYPVIVKPSDSSGSRGVVLVSNHLELADAIQYSQSFSSSGWIVIQEFLEGMEVSVEGFSINGEPVVIAITDKVTSGAPHFVEIGHSQPSKQIQSTQEEIRRVAKSAVEALGISNCAFHAEIMVTADGPKVIEIGARLGGDFITSSLVPLSTGVDMVAAIVDISMGLTPELSSKKNQGSAVRFLERNGNPKMVERTKRLEGIVSVEIQPKSEKTAIQNSNDRFGSIIAVGKNAAEAIANASQAHNILVSK